MELTKIRGISEKREEDLNKLGVFDTADLIGFFPRRYIDLREKQFIKNVYDNETVLTAAVVVSVPSVRYYRRGGVVKIVCEQEGFAFTVVWFNQPYVASKLKPGVEYLFYGRVKNDFGTVTMYNPSFEPCEKAFRLKGIVPQYQMKGCLTQKIVRDAARLAVDLEKPSSVIPEYLKVKYQLEGLYAAYKEVHNPSSFEAERKAANRIAVEEYFKLITAFRILKGSREQVRINKYSTTRARLDEYIKTTFPFAFTDGQSKAVDEIYGDMSGCAVMNRLLQGDVGCGKTAVSVCAAFVAVDSGYQVAMLSPTEVLATQNYEVLKKYLPSANVALLTGSMTAKEKRMVKAGISAGFYHVLVGTHAVLTDDVEFKNLSLCVCDEQQRFGVAQRSKLLNKGVTPDVLVMSATPIPRTLSLIFYGDLDVTAITDKPATRVQIQTNIVPQNKYNDMLGFIEKEIKNGRQAYLVCPKIEGDDEGTVTSATELYQSVKAAMPNVSVGLLHGKMKDDLKASVMQDFKDGKIGLLVSTTVIEVGVDVPNASVMVIYGAERFGLSQLHQLRGRVGRSDIKSYCFLLSGSNSETAIERLKIIKDNSDGFKIAEQDYKLRGAGDFMGNRQSGKFIGDLGALNYGTEAIFLAKKISDDVFASGNLTDDIREVALKKYEKLKDIALN